MKKKNILLFLTIILSIILITACTPKEKDEYKEIIITANVAEEVTQKTYTSNELIVIAFMGPSIDNVSEIEITIFDNSNNVIAIVPKAKKDIGFDKYPYEYIFSITIQKDQFPAAKTAKITNYKYITYEKI